MQKRIVVTGGAGFLGSHLCERLLQQGDVVLCIDNFLTGSKKNILSFLKHPNFFLYEHDICEPIDIAFDELYNLACPASPLHYQKDPIKTLKTNIFGSINMLELAVLKGAKIFQASTSEVYGDPLVHPQKEEYFGNVNPVGIRSCYDEGKRCAETIFFDYWRTHQIPIKVARIFNTYGPRMQQDDGRVVSNFIVQALLQRPLTIFGDGSQTRSFCYVEDMVDGFIHLMNSSDKIVGPMNLGNPEEYTILELAKMILWLTNSSSKIIFCKLPEDDPKKRNPEIEKAFSILKWKPKISIEEGLQKTIVYFKTIIESSVS